VAQLHGEGKWLGPGEEAAARLFQQGLPASWHVFCNKLLAAPTYAPPLYYELDFVVVGEHGVFVVDEKSWAGPISGTESFWRVGKGRRDSDSPVRTVDMRSRTLRGALERRDSRLKSLRAFVSGYVLLSNDNDISQLHAPIGKSAILGRTNACERLMAADERQAVASIAPYRDRVVAMLEDKPRRQGNLRAFAEYEVVEELPAAGPLRTFLATSVDGAERILRVMSRREGLDCSQAGRDYLLREYDVLQKLQTTDRVPRVHDRFAFQWTEELWVIPIERVAGRTLRQLREEAGGVHDDDAAARTLRLMADAFRGLADIHACGVLHRGLNPDRIVVRSSDDRVIFTDFLIARTADDETVAPTASEMDPGNIFWSPECFVGPEFAEPATDVYGLAASLVWLLTGIEPQAAGEWSAELQARLPSTLGDSVCDALVGCLAQDALDRPTVDEMIHVLEPERTPEVAAAQRIDVGVEIDGYLVVKLLGSGGTADSWLADDPVSGRQWVLKVIRDPDVRERLARQEFDALMQLRSAYFPRVLDVKPAEHPYQLRIEYVDGEALTTLLETNAGDVHLFDRVAHDLLAALEQLRASGLVHRDVSAANVLVPDVATEPVELIDFGLAASRGDAGSSGGTRLYMPPEVERGVGGWTHQGDLYSAAVLLFQLLTGRLPYETTKQGRRKDRIVAPTPDERSRCGDRRLSALLGACDPDPGRRPASAAELLEALDAPEPAAPRSRRRGWIAVAIAAVVCVALVVAVLSVWGGGEDAAGSAVSWSAAAALVGDGGTHTVAGPVRSMLVSGDYAYISLGRPYPDSGRFTVRVPAPSSRADAAGFAPLLGAEVEARGQVVDIAGQAGMDVVGSSEVVIVKAGPLIIDWSDAKQHEGELVVVQGVPLRSRFRGDRPGHTTYIDFNARYPSEDRFTVKIAEDDRTAHLGLMGTSDFSGWSGRDLWVRGVVRQADQSTAEFVPQIDADPLTDIWAGPASGN